MKGQLPSHVEPGAPLRVRLALYRSKSSRELFRYLATEIRGGHQPGPVADQAEHPWDCLRPESSPRRLVPGPQQLRAARGPRLQDLGLRSEERRVGKECGSPSGRVELSIKKTYM